MDVAVWRLRASWSNDAASYRPVVKLIQRLILQFCGSVVTSDAGLLASRERDDALGPTVMPGEMLTDARTGNNRGARIARAVHINGNAVAPMRAARFQCLSLASPRSKTASTCSM